MRAVNEYKRTLFFSGNPRCV